MRRTDTEYRMNLSFKLFPEIHDSRFNHFNTDICKLVCQRQLWSTISYLTFRTDITYCMKVDGDMTSYSQPLYHLLKSEARKTMRCKTVIVLYETFAILSLSQSKSYSISIHIASMLDTKNTFEWLIYHDVLYALFTELTRAKLVFIASYLTPDTIESNRFH